MPDANQVTTLVVALSILVLAVALVGGGAILAVRGGRLVLGGLALVLGLGVAAGALLFTLSPVVARRYRPEEPEDGDGG